MPRDLLSITLVDAFGHEGCPICTLLSRQERQWMESFLWENVNDRGVRQRILASWGFCHRHAWWMVQQNQLGGHLAMSIIYENVIARLLDLHRPSSEPHLSLRRATGAHAGRLLDIRPGHPCPTCTARAGMEDAYVRSLSRYCREEWFATLYQQSDSLCLGHLRQALAVSTGKTRILLLMTGLAKTAKALERLRAVPAAGDPSTDISSTVRCGLMLLVGADVSVGDAQHDGSLLGEEVVQCPACSAEREREETALNELVLAAQAQPARAFSLCRAHAWQLYGRLQSQSHQPLASWCIRALQESAQDLENLLAEEKAPKSHRGPLPWRQRRPASPTAPTRECMVCTQKAQAGQGRRGDRSADEGRDPARFHEADRLCLPHWQLAACAASPASAQVLQQQRLARLQTLRSQLREFIHKSDWANRHEPKGEEQTAWHKAIAMFTGDP